MIALILGLGYIVAGTTFLREGYIILYNALNHYDYVTSCRCNDSPTFIILPHEDGRGATEEDRDEEDETVEIGLESKGDEPANRE